MNASQIFLLVAVIRLAGLVLAGLLVTALPHHSQQASATSSTLSPTVGTTMYDNSVAAQLSDMRLHD